MNYDSLEGILIKLKNEFNIEDLKDYQALIFLIYYFVFLNRDYDEQTKLQVFALLDSIVNKIQNLSIDNNSRCRDDNCRNDSYNGKFKSYEDLYNYILPARVRDTELFFLYRMDEKFFEKEGPFVQK